ncbi:MAG: spore cortex biosynthesis protein YabQ [Oscillospiraceae bacterium]
MEIRVGEQAMALALALLLGLGTGLLYDLLRPLRRLGGKPLAAAADAAFAFASAFGLFVFAMQADNGRLGTWELAAALLGFLLYMHSLSLLVLPVLDKIFQILGKGLRALENNLKKNSKTLKKPLPKNKRML